MSAYPPSAAANASSPWYREPWPWLLMAGPVIVVVAGFITLAYAIQSSDGLVVDDYYKRGKEVNRDLSRDDEARRMALTATLDRDAHQGLRIRLESPYAPAQLDLTLAHATRQGLDQRARARRGPDGLYTTPPVSLRSGKWHVRLEDASRRWLLTGVLQVAADAIATPDTPKTRLTPRDR
jgi:hypothetical protein